MSFNGILLNAFLAMSMSKAKQIFIPPIQPGLNLLNLVFAPEAPISGMKA